MSKTVVGPTHDDHQSSGWAATDKYKHLTGPAPGGPSREIGSARFDQSEQHHNGYDRKLPAPTSSSSYPRRNSYVSTSSPPSSDFFGHSQHSASRSGGVEGPANSLGPRSIPNPATPGSSTVPSTDSIHSARISNYPARHDVNSAVGLIGNPPQRPPLSIPEPTPVPSRASPASTVSSYGPQTAFNSRSHAASPAPLAGRVGAALPPPMSGTDAIANRPMPAGGPLPRATQYMTVETSHGQMQIPMDVQGASRVADEKRRRNAGASARFRARRKEKEKASSREIEDLKKRIGDLSEDCEFYRQERDVLAAALSNNSEGLRLFPRPASPRRRRTLVDTSSRSASTQNSPRLLHIEERGEHGTNGAHTRRRLYTPPSQYSNYSMQTQGSNSQQTATLPPLQAPQANQTATQLPQLRSVSYPGHVSATSSGPTSPWNSTSHSQSQSQSQSRSHSSSRSYQSGP